MTKETHHPPLMGLNHTAHYAKALMRPTPPRTRVRASPYPSAKFKMGFLLAHHDEKFNPIPNISKTVGFLTARVDDKAICPDYRATFGWLLQFHSLIISNIIYKK